MRKVEKAAREVVKSLEQRNPDHPVEFFYKEFAGNVINFTIRFWTTDSDFSTFIQARSEAIKAIKETFDQLEIAMVP